MQLKLYKSLDEKNRIRKTLTGELVLNGALRDNSSVIKPTILIQTDPLDYNYAYIPEFGRYYYITNITAFRKNAWLIDLKCDVLMSYADDIYRLRALIDREETQSQQYVSGDFVLDARHNTEKIAFNNPFTEKNYILVTLKGGNN